MSSNTPSIKKNFILSTLYQILAVVLPFITAPYVSRVLGAGNIGIYSYTASIQTYFSMFAALGTASYGSREIARSRNDVQRRSQLLWEIELLTVVMSAVCVAVWFIFIAFNTRYRIYYLVLTMGILSTMFDISWFFEGLEQFSYIVSKNALFKLAGFILTFVLVRDKDDLVVYMIIMTASVMLGNLSMWIYLPKFTVRIPLRTLRIKRHFKETLVYFIPTIATSIYTVLDKTLIGLITMDESENGYYEQATKIIRILEAITFVSLNNILGSRISYLFAENKQEEIYRRIRESMDYILFMGIGICFGLIGVAPRFVPLYFGAGYERVIGMLCLMSPIVVIIGVSNCLGSQYYNPVGKRSTSAKFIIAGSCVNLILNLLLIPRYWGFGAVVASVIAESVISVLYLNHCDGYLTWKILGQQGWKKAVSGAIMLGAIHLIDGYLKNDFVACVIDIIVGGLIYLAVLFLLKDSFINGFVLDRVRNKLHKASS